MKTIKSSELQSILNLWQLGEINEYEIHAWAEDRFCSSNFEPESEAVNEVLSRLDTMNMNLTISEDAQYLLKALNSKNFQFYLDELDKSVIINQRVLTLKNNPFYSKFCVITPSQN